MAEYREVTHHRLYVKEPGTERLRKSAEGWLRYRLANGWKETDRWHADHYVTVRLERSGYAPRMTRLPKIAPVQGRPPRRGFGPGGPGQGPRG
jgi:hypothetical protein